MIQPIYTQDQLYGKTLPQLKEIAKSLGLKPSGNKAYKHVWIDSILVSQSRPASVNFLYLSNGTIHANFNGNTLVLNYATDEVGCVKYKVEKFVSTYNYELLAACDNCEIAKSWAEAYLLGKDLPMTTVEEEVTHCSDCPYFASFDEASGRGCCKLFDKVARAHHPRTSDCDKVAEAHEQVTNELPKTTENWETQEVVVEESQMELEAHIEELAKSVAPENKIVFVSAPDRGVDLEARFNGVVVADIDLDAFDNKESWDVTMNGKVHEGFPTKEAAMEFVQLTCGYPQIGNPDISQIKRQIAASDIEVLEVHGERYVVRNQTNGNHYVVNPSSQNPQERCECGDAQFRRSVCKHQLKVLSMISDFEQIAFEDCFPGDRIIVQGAELSVVNSREGSSLDFIEVWCEDEQGKRLHILRRASDRVWKKKRIKLGIKVIPKLAREVTIGDGIVIDEEIWQVCLMRKRDVVARAWQSNVMVSQIIITLKNSEGRSKEIYPLSETELQIAEF